MNKDVVNAIKHRVIGMKIDEAKSLLLSFGLPYFIISDNIQPVELNDFCVCLTVKEGYVAAATVAYESK